jgi:uncharacterized protein (TIGR00661 family)
MARILYGVMGNTHGHIMRSLAIAQRFPEHEFTFVGGGRVPEALQGRYPCLTVPVLRTKHRAGRLDLAGTIGQILLCEAQIPSVFAKLHRLVREWQPDLAITDREFYLPIYARLTGLPCISIDHTHLLKACQFEIPQRLRRIWRLTLLNDYLLFNFTRRNLIVSFFEPPRRAGSTDEIFPPVLRPEVARLSATKGDHIFVYLSIPHFAPLLAALQNQPRPVIVYGQHPTLSTMGNVTFKPYHQEHILRDLAGSAYAVVNGGHNLICEALYYGKPVLCFPIDGLIEQFINVDYLRRLGYGEYTYEREPLPEIFTTFEKSLALYEKAITDTFEDGTPRLVKRLGEIIHELTAKP